MRASLTAIYGIATYVFFVVTFAVCDRFCGQPGRAEVDR